MLYEVLMQNVEHVKTLIGLQYTKIIFYPLTSREHAGIICLRLNTIAMLIVKLQKSNVKISRLTIVYETMVLT